MKTPESKKELQRFLGLTSYYIKFIYYFADIFSPILNLLKNKSFVWREEFQISFEKLKDCLTPPEVLTFPDLSKEFI